jgi:hypothetical protein
MFPYSPNFRVLADVSGDSGATNNFYFKPELYKITGLQYLLETGDGTLKVYGSLNPDEGSEDHTWEDISEGLFNAVSITQSSTLIDNGFLLTGFALIKVEVVSTIAYEYKILLKQA